MPSYGPKLATVKKRSSFAFLLFFLAISRRHTIPSVLPNGFFEPVTYLQVGKSFVDGKVLKVVSKLQ